MSVQDVANAIQTVITANVQIPGSSPPKYLRAFPYLKDQFSVPCALVAPNTIDPHTALGTQARYEFIIFLILSRTSDRTQLQAMADYMSVSGASSIQAAIEQDQSLGRSDCGAFIVTKIGPPSAITINGNPYIGCPFTVAGLSSA